MANGKPHRDPETGEWYASKRWAWLVDILKLWPILLLVGGYIITHEVRHDRIGTFIDAGPRLTPQMLEDKLALKTDEAIQTSRLAREVAENTAAIKSLQISNATLTVEIRTLQQSLNRVEQNLLSLLSD